MKTKYTADQLDLETSIDRTGDLRSDPLLGQRIEAHAKEVRALLALMTRRQLGLPMSVAA